MRDTRYTFYVELKSKKHVKNISISDEAHDRVLFERDLEEPTSLSLLDGEMLKLEGEKRRVNHN